MERPYANHPSPSVKDLNALTFTYTLSKRVHILVLINTQENYKFYRLNYVHYDQLLKEILILFFVFLFKQF